MLQFTQFMHRLIHWIIGPVYRHLPPKLQHAMLFIIAGGIGFTVDSTILLTLEHGFGISPFMARIFSVMAGTCTSWLAHRTLTFAVSKAPTWAEFTTFVALSFSSATLNYVSFSLLIWAAVFSHSLPALVCSSLIAMMYSYLGMRFGVFRKTHTLKKRES
jgi:putative flippase GtrA